MTSDVYIIVCIIDRNRNSGSVKIVSSQEYLGAIVIPGSYGKVLISLRVSLSLIDKSVWLFKNKYLALYVYKVPCNG